MRLIMKRRRTAQGFIRHVPVLIAPLFFRQSSPTMQFLLRHGARLTVAGLLLWNSIQGLAGSRLAYAQQAASTPVISAPVTPLRVTVDPKSLEVGAPGPMVTVPEGEPLPTVPPPPRRPIPDPVIQSSGVVRGEATELLSDPEVNIPGITSASNPPDTVGDVGAGHFVQMVNATRFQIWDKSGNDLTGALIFGNLWPVGDTCRSNAGDPIVVYDHLADRWLLSQFASPTHMCIAISQTPDPTEGTWILYEFNVGVFPDYPKFGVWPDGYYMSSYEPPNLGVYAFDRDNMLLGNPASFSKTNIPALGAPGVRDTRILPSDLDGPPPPVGTPNFFVRTVDDQQHPANPTDRIEVYEFAVDWVNQNFSFTLVDTLSPAPFNMMLCNQNGGGVRDCIPQPNTTSTVDALSNRPMMQLKVRDFGKHMSMVTNQTIDVSGSMPIATASEVAGIRWYELRKSDANWTIYQEGTFAPQPEGVTAENQLLHRWMGSAAMDKDGSIALGYSIVNDDDDDDPVFPGIRYTGRRFDDPLGLMQDEKIIVDGSNSQTGGFGRRWGDYSALSVDPVDDCTFWYTTHVAGMGGAGPRPTRIASFRFDSCVPPPPGPDIDVQPASWDYGNVLVGSTSDQDFTVSNTGTQDLNVTEVSLVGTDPGEFAIIAGGEPFTLLPGEIWTVTVQFAPTSGEAKTAILQFTSDDPDENPKDIALSGTGTAAGQ